MMEKIKYLVNIFNAYHHKELCVICQITGSFLSLALLLALEDDTSGSTLPPQSSLLVTSLNDDEDGSDPIR